MGATLRAIAAACSKDASDRTMGPIGCAASLIVVSDHRLMGRGAIAVAWIAVATETTAIAAHRGGGVGSRRLRIVMTRPETDYRPGYFAGARALPSLFALASVRSQASAAGLRPPRTDPSVRPIVGLW
ncbi:MAG: hypothetical protein KF745_00205 [Phycisphaeraceae bacterium]|nr:hypothetical protein [Phycisphaeraceae bacterium]